MQKEAFSYDQGNLIWGVHRLRNIGTFLTMFELFFLESCTIDKIVGRPALHLNYSPLSRYAVETSPQSKDLPAAHPFPSARNLRCNRSRRKSFIRVIKLFDPFRQQLKTFSTISPTPSCGKEFNPKITPRLMALKFHQTNIGKSIYGDATWNNELFDKSL